MNIRELRAELAAKPRPVYLVSGNDAYMRELARRAFVAAVPDASSAFNLASISAHDTEPAIFWREMDTLPMMGAEFRVVILTDWQKADKELEEAVSSYLDSPNLSSVLVLMAEKADMRKKISSRLKAGGMLVECETPDKDKVAAYVIQQARERGYDLPLNVAKLVVDLTRGEHGDLGRAVQATMMLLDFAGERRTITQADVQTLVGRVEDRTLFKLADAMAQRKPGDAISIFHNLITRPDEVISTIGMLERHFRLLVIVKEHSKASPADIARIIGVNPYYVKDYISQARNFPPEKLSRIIADLSRLDVNCKTGGTEPMQGLELFILQACA